MTTRVDIIEEVLIYHRNHHGLKGLTCNCGYVHPLGASIMLHRAQLIDESLRYREENMQ